MSSSQYYSDCPVCWENTLSVNESDGFFPNMDTQCENCGFYTTTNVWISNLEVFLDERFDSWYEEQEEDLTYEEYREKFNKEVAPKLKKEHEEHLKTYKETFSC